MKIALHLLLAALLCLAAGCQKATVSPPAIVMEPSAPAATAAPTLTPSPAPTPVPEPFYIIWMSDTQSYTGMQLKALESMMSWVAETCRTEPVAAFVHTGDIVNNPGNLAQWENYRQAASVLPRELLRLSAAGNHDIGVDGLSPENYLQYRCDTPPDPAASFLDGLCRYATLESGGMRLLILSIAYMHETESLEWARGVLAAHPDHYGILIVHSYLTLKDSEMNQGYTGGGAILRDGLVKAAPNLRMVLCGHTRGSASRPLFVDDDGDGQPEREVHQFMLDYQGDDPQTIGYLRTIRFDLMADSIELRTYSPCMDAEGCRGDPLGAVHVIEAAGLSAYSANAAPH